jgi:hypothetical protein
VSCSQWRVYFDFTVYNSFTLFFMYNNPNVASNSHWLIIANNNIAPCGLSINLHLHGLVQLHFGFKSMHPRCNDLLKNAIKLDGSVRGVFLWFLSHHPRLNLIASHNILRSPLLSIIRIKTTKAGDEEISHKKQCRILKISRMHF